MYLVQKGSAESKGLYENSLAIAFLLLFVGSFVGHAVGGVDEYNAKSGHTQIPKLASDLRIHEPGSETCV